MKTTGILIPPSQVKQLRQNIRRQAWAAAERDRIVALAETWRRLSDSDLRALMFGNTITRAWDIGYGGFCPACKGDIPYMEPFDALSHPWKIPCPHCHELFPKNDFYAFYRSGLDADGVFEPAQADRSLLFNSEHPDPEDPLHLFGVDDGEGYVEDEHRWRYIGHYLIRGQWRQWVLDGLCRLSEAYVLTGDPVYAHKADVLFNRVADLHPTFDFGKQGVIYQKPADRGYVSTWHHACIEVREMAVAFDLVFDGLGEVTRNKVNERILNDVLANRTKINSNPPDTDITIILIRLIQGWPENREEVVSLMDAVFREATAVDGLTGEKGIPGYACFGPRSIAFLLSRVMLMDGGLVRQLLRNFPRLHKLYRFHMDTWCLRQYYPMIGDYGWFGERITQYPAVPWGRIQGSGQQPLPAGLMPSLYSLFWQLYERTGDPAFVQVLYRANGDSVAGLPHDLYAEDQQSFQQSVQAVIDREGADVKVDSVNLEEWHLAILRAGRGADARAAWVSYDSWGRHGHANAMNLGLYAKGLDLLPDNGYPPLKFGHSSRFFNWYWSTAAHNTVVVDGRNQARFDGKTTLWEKGDGFQVMRFEPDMIPCSLIGPNHEQIGFFFTTPGRISRVRVLTRLDPDGEWTLQFEDSFDRVDLGTNWTILHGEWRIETGHLVGYGTVLCARKFPGVQRVEFEAVTDSPNPCDLSALLATDERGGDHGIFFGLGADYNQRSLIMYDRRPARDRAAVETKKVLIIPGHSHRVVCEHDGTWLRHWVDDVLIQSCVNDGMPHLAIAPNETSDRKRYARTVMLVDISDDDCYLVDLFDVTGGHDHAKFIQSNYSTLTTQGLELLPAEEYGYGTLMRNFQGDAKAVPGWTADWKIDGVQAGDACDRDVHLRYTDLTEGVAAYTCEGWIAKQGVEETWIPRLMVRRQSKGETLSSRFIAVLEPYVGTSRISHIRRTGLSSLEIDLQNGRRDYIEWTPEGRISLASQKPK